MARNPDGRDVGLLLAAWGECPDPANCPADLTGDGAVGNADLHLMLGIAGATEK